MKRTFLRTLRTYGFITLGCAVYALSFQWFFAANDIAYGGATGVAQLLHAAFGRPDTGVLIALINIPLFLAGWRLLGRRVLVRSLYSVAVSAFFIDLIGAVHTFDPMEPLLACVYGGVTLGAALGFIFRQGATTGGTDVAARLMRLRFPGLSLGRLVLILDLGIIVGCALVFGQMHSALYGLIALYISSIAIDNVLYGPDSCRMAYIISDRYREISDLIVHRLERGVTLLPGQGGFSGTERTVLLCVLRKHEVLRLKRAVQQADPNAFLIVCDAREVLGMGFMDSPAG